MSSSYLTGGRSLYRGVSLSVRRKISIRFPPDLIKLPPPPSSFTQFTLPFAIHTPKISQSLIISLHASLIRASFKLHSSSLSLDHTSPLPTTPPWLSLFTHDHLLPLIIARPPSSAQQHTLLSRPSKQLGVPSLTLLWYRLSALNLLLRTI